MYRSRLTEKLHEALGAVASVRAIVLLPVTDAAGLRLVQAEEEPQ